MIKVKNQSALYIQDFTMHYLEVVKLVGFGGQAVTHECVVSEFCSVILLNSESISFARCSGVHDLTFVA